MLLLVFFVDDVIVAAVDVVVAAPAPAYDFVFIIEDVDVSTAVFLLGLLSLLLVWFIIDDDVVVVAMAVLLLLKMRAPMILCPIRIEVESLSKENHDLKNIRSNYPQRMHIAYLPRILQFDSHLYCRSYAYLVKQPCNI